MIRNHDLKFWKSNDAFGFSIPDRFWSNFMDNQYFISWYHHWQKKSNLKFWKSNTRLGFSIPDCFWLNHMAKRYFISWYYHWRKKTNLKFWKSEDGFGLPVVDILRLEHFQTLKISTYYLLRSLFVRPFARNLYADSNSPASITQRPTMFELSIVNNC